MADRTRGWRNRTRAPSSSRPAAWAGEAAPVSMPCFSTARHNSVTSPVGSAAAVSNNRRVSSGSAWTCRWKLCSIRLATADALGSPKPPASSAAVNPSGSCTSASGFPRASAMILSRTRSSRRPRIAAPNTSRASLSAERRDGELGQAHQFALLAGFAHAEHQCQPIRYGASRHEGQHLEGSPIEPLRVIDEAGEWVSVRQVGQQSQDGETEQKPVRSIAFGQPECHPQRVALRCRQVLDAVEHRRAELVQAGKREFHLGLDAEDAGDTEIRCALEVGSPAAPSCRNRPHRARPRWSCYPHAPHPADVRVPRTRRAVPAVWARPWWMVVTAPTPLASCRRNGSGLQGRFDRDLNVLRSEWRSDRPARPGPRPPGIRLVKAGHHTRGRELGAADPKPPPSFGRRPIAIAAGRRR